ncbi:hypothetical protein CHLRE_22g753947v5 [Chlamydomonas reinhardtii]|uniref:Uncharacterized protein n=1 Tax=Chlamydomonas reinhardtii TaxID=3055 RepID=A0A2K3CN81_CHLRE|nr:uncharacterized protein CHLRE_22g753947v5 [Chlamydomonas reinhardtii]PNW69737.1 hypothetical protein CHLRE_22g753947v5 [Chlamydomonas reinhardtii]
MKGSDQEHSRGLVTALVRSSGAASLEKEEKEKEEKEEKEMLPAAGAAEPVVAGVAEPAPAVSASDASDTEQQQHSAAAASDYGGLTSSDLSDGPGDSEGGSRPLASDKGDDGLPGLDWEWAVGAHTIPVRSRRAAGRITQHTAV